LSAIHRLEEAEVEERYRRKLRAARALEAERELELKRVRMDASRLTKDHLATRGALQEARERCQTLGERVTALSRENEVLEAGCREASAALESAASRERVLAGEHRSALLATRGEADRAKAKARDAEEAAKAAVDARHALLERLAERDARLTSVDRELRHAARAVEALRSGFEEESSLRRAAESALAESRGSLQAREAQMREFVEVFLPLAETVETSLARHSGESTASFERLFALVRDMAREGSMSGGRGGGLGGPARRGLPVGARRPVGVRVTGSGGVAGAGSGGAAAAAAAAVAAERQGADDRAELAALRMQCALLTDQNRALQRQADASVPRRWREAGTSSRLVSPLPAPAGDTPLEADAVTPAVSVPAPPGTAAEAAAAAASPTGPANAAAPARQVASSPGDAGAGPASLSRPAPPPPPPPAPSPGVPAVPSVGAATAALRDREDEERLRTALAEARSDLDALISDLATERGRAETAEARATALQAALERAGLASVAEAEGRRLTEGEAAQLAGEAVGLATRAAEAEAEAGRLTELNASIQAASADLRRNLGEQRGRAEAAEASVGRLERQLASAEGQLRILSTSSGELRAALGGERAKAEALRERLAASELRADAEAARAQAMDKAVDLVGKASNPAAAAAEGVRREVETEDLRAEVGRLRTLRARAVGWVVDRAEREAQTSAAVEALLRWRAGAAASSSARASEMAEAAEAAVVRAEAAAAQAATGGAGLRARPASVTADADGPDADPDPGTAAADEQPVGESSRLRALRAAHDATIERLHETIGETKASGLLLEQRLRRAEEEADRSLRDYARASAVWRVVTRWTRRAAAAGRARAREDAVMAQGERDEARTALADVMALATRDEALVQAMPTEDLKATVGAALAGLRGRLGEAEARARGLLFAGMVLARRGCLTGAFAAWRDATLTAALSGGGSSGVGYQAEGRARTTMVTKMRRTVGGGGAGTSAGKTVGAGAAAAGLSSGRVPSGGRAVSRRGPAPLASAPAGPRRIYIGETAPMPAPAPATGPAAGGPAWLPSGLGPGLSSRPSPVPPSPRREAHPPAAAPLSRRRSDSPSPGGPAAAVEPTLVAFREEPAAPVHPAATADFAPPVPPPPPPPTIDLSKREILTLGPSGPRLEPVPDLSVELARLQTADADALRDELRSEIVALKHVLERQGDAVGVAPPARSSQIARAPRTTEVAGAVGDAAGDVASARLAAQLVGPPHVEGAAGPRYHVWAGGKREAPLSNRLDRLHALSSALEASTVSMRAWLADSRETAQFHCVPARAEAGQSALEAATATADAALRGGPDVPAQTDPRPPPGAAVLAGVSVRIRGPEEGRSGLEGPRQVLIRRRMTGPRGGAVEPDA